MEAGNIKLDEGGTEEPALIKTGTEDVNQVKPAGEVAGIERAILSNIPGGEHDELRVIVYRMLLKNDSNPYRRIFGSSIAYRAGVTELAAPRS